MRRFRNKKTVRLFITQMLILSMLVLFAGCAGNKGIEGTWVLAEEIEANGNKLTGEDLQQLGVSEQYVISGTEVKYTGSIPGLQKSIELTFELKENGKNEYEFNLPGGINFATVTLKGNKMTYVAGTKDSATTMIFKRK